MPRAQAPVRQPPRVGMAPRAADVRKKDEQPLQAAYFLQPP
jgi:hypothetical protein